MSNTKCVRCGRVIKDINDVRIYRDPITGDFVAHLTVCSNCRKLQDLGVVDYPDWKESNDT